MLYELSAETKMIKIEKLLYLYLKYWNKYLLLYLYIKGQL